MTRQALALFVGALISVTAAQTATAAVTVRVEGAQTTLVPRTAVTVPAQAPKPDGTNGCAAASVGGVLWAATAGRWSGTYYGSFGDYGLETILGETHTFSDADGITYYVYKNGGSAFGTCTEAVADGDDVLVAACPADPSFNCAWPRLVLTAAATASPTGLAVKVERLAGDGITRTPEPGVTVTDGAASAVTDAAGAARLTPAARGPLTIRASKTDFIRDSRAVCVTDGADGFCGTAVAPGVTPPPPGTVTGESCSTNGRDGFCGTGDTTKPLAAASSLSAKVFARGKAPRQLRGTVETDGSGIKAVELRLTRRSGARCQTYDGQAERWKTMRRCGAERGTWFNVGSSASWSYLLPATPTRGRYVLDVRVTDGAGNASDLARGSTRSVFSVR